MSDMTVGNVPQMMANVQFDVGVGLPCNSHSRSLRLQRPSKKASIPIGKLHVRLMARIVIVRNKIRKLLGPQLFIVVTTICFAHSFISTH